MNGWVGASCRMTPCLRSHEDRGSFDQGWIYFGEDFLSIATMAPTSCRLWKPFYGGRAGMVRIYCRLPPWLRLHEGRGSFEGSGRGPKAVPKGPKSSHASRGEKYGSGRCEPKLNGELVRISDMYPVIVPTCFF